MEKWEYKEIAVQPYENPDTIVQREAANGWEEDAREMGTSDVGSSSTLYSIPVVRKIRLKRRKQ